MWTNLINNKRYIGSSKNLNKRFREYFNTNYLIKDNCMQICRALKKHDYSNFSLTILEYCSPDKCLIREGYYLKLLNPEYNISKDPSAPMSGRTHSDATKQIMSDVHKGKTLSDDTKTKISDAQKKSDNSGRFKTGENHPGYGQTRSEDTKTKISDTMQGRPKPAGSGSPSQQIEVTDIKNNITTSYNSMSEAAKALNIQNAIIVIYFSRNQKKPYKGQYTFKKL